jgi:hypothetical protein
VRRVSLIIGSIILFLVKIGFLRAIIVTSESLSRRSLLAPKEKAKLVAKRVGVASPILTSVEFIFSEPATRV